MMSLEFICNKTSVIRVFYVLNILKSTIFIVLPIILIISIFVKLFKNIINEKGDVKELVSSCLKKIILCLIIFFIPAIANIFIKIIDSESINSFNECMKKGNVESIKKYKTVSEVENVFKRLESSLTESNYEKAEEALASLYYIVDGDTVNDYVYRLSTAYSKMYEKDEYDACAKQGGTYHNGVCKYPKNNQKINPNLIYDPNSENNNNTNGENSSQTNLTPAGNGMLLYTFKTKNDYYVVNSKYNVENYLKLVKSKRLCQDQKNGTVYGDQCLCFAEEHVHALVTGKAVTTPSKIPHKYYSSNFIKSYDNDDKSLVLAKIYDQLVHNKPVIVQVNGNVKGTSRHYVAIIGMKSSVTNQSSLKDTDLLLIDSYSCRVEQLHSKGTSRFMVTGKACHKNYSGYQIYYIV